MDTREKDDGLDAAFIISQTRSRNRPLHAAPARAEEAAPAGAEHAADPISSQIPKDEGRRRRGKGQDYESLFIRNAPSNTRSGKTVYIRKEFHERITRIVQVIG